MLAQRMKFLDSLNLENMELTKDKNLIKNRIQEGIVFSHSIDLHLIRHAESKINAKKLVTGSQDVELTLVGKKQAVDLGKKLSKEYDIALVSGLKRAQKTLEIAIRSGNIKVDKIYQDIRLNERSLGVLEGRVYRWIPEYARGELNYAPQGGESYELVAYRILSFLIDLADYSHKHSVKRILISSHMGPMRILLGILLEEENSVSVLNMKFSNTEIIKISWKHLKLPGFLRYLL